MKAIVVKFRELIFEKVKEIIPNTKPRFVEVDHTPMAYLGGGLNVHQYTKGSKSYVYTITINLFDEKSHENRLITQTYQIIRALEGIFDIDGISVNIRDVNERQESYENHKLTHSIIELTYIIN